MSVVVTSYNHAEYLKQRMDTLLAQSYPNIEILVIDDCSTDNSLEVLEEYSKYRHIKIIALPKNGGYAAACNHGVSLSNGDYIMFAECDDFNDPIHIEMLMERLIANESVGVAYCRSNMVDSKGIIFGDDFQYREKRFQYHCAQDILIPQTQMQKYFLKSCVIPNMSAALIIKDCIIRAGGLSSDYRICADWDFWCRLAENTDFYYVAKPLNYFRTHETTARNTFGIGIHVREYYKLLYNALPKAKLSKIENMKYRLHYGRLWANFVTRNPREWLSCFSAARCELRQYETYCIVFLFFGMLVNISSALLKLVKRRYSARHSNG